MASRVAVATSARPASQSPIRYPLSARSRAPLGFDDSARCETPESCTCHAFGDIASNCISGNASPKTHSSIKSPLPALFGRAIRPHDPRAPLTLKPHDRRGQDLHAARIHSALTPPGGFGATARTWTAGAGEKDGNRPIEIRASRSLLFHSRSRHSRGITATRRTLGVRGLRGQRARRDAPQGALHAAGNRARASESGAGIGSVGMSAPIPASSRRAA